MTATPSHRVIVVGRGVAVGDLETRLRRDPQIELIRARHPLDAIGEAAEDLEDLAGQAVVVMPGAVPEAERSDFAAAIRRVDPGAVVLGPEAGRLDGPGLRAKVAAPQKDAPKPEARAPRPKAPASPAGGTAQEEPDAPILKAVVRGADALEPCIVELRRRLRDPSLRFEAEGSGAEAVGGSAVAAVERGGKRFGDLVADAKVSPGALRSAAEWLALWLTLRDQHAQLRHAAYTDGLTGVWNRRYFDAFLPRALEHARASRHELSLLLFDIDDFKQYNDRHGHAAGDEILCEIVRLLRSVVRPADRVCRIGGDEFAVVFYEPEGPREADSRHPASIAEITARFQRRVAEHHFPRLGEHAPGQLSVSGGMATFPWDATEAGALIERADALMLDSKAHGKNTITFGPGLAGASGGSQAGS